MAVLKSLYYVGGFTMGGYFLMKAVERDPESFRKHLPEKHVENYAEEKRKKNAAFMYVMKSVSEGVDPATAVERLKTEKERLDAEVKKSLEKEKDGTSTKPGT